MADPRHNPPPLAYGRPVQRRTWRLARVGVLLAVTMSLLGYAAYRSRVPPRLPAATSSTAPTVKVDPRVELESQRQRDRQFARGVYQEEIVPLLDQFDARNAAAAARAVADAHERLNGRRWGIKPFIRDVGSWRTRFGVIGRSTSDLWHKIRRQPASGAVRAYVQAKFRHHVLSEAALESDLGETLKHFREDVEASRNLLYVQLELPLEKIRATAPSVTPDLEGVKADVSRRSSQLAVDWGSDSVVTGLTSFVGGWVAADVAQGVTSRVVVAILSRVGTQVAAQTLAAGGATAAGAATGGGGGSLAGPAGTVIGLGIGVAVGAAIDWWMSERFEARMTEQLNRFFDSVDAQLIKGNERSPGLERALHEAVRLGGLAQRQALERAIQQQQQELQ
ncbi:MAG TPA: hypothetical protein VH475_04340 [Tepidisphaeraceae bacterium]